jgi:acyl-CoA thioesterase-1
MNVVAVDDWCGQIRHPIFRQLNAGSPALASYGGLSVPIQSICRVVAALAIVAALGSTGAEARTIRIVALGDSLIAGYGLDQVDTFTSKVAAALKARGEDVEVINAGVSGDTAGDGLARADWSVGEDTDAVIVELGANDALRGIDPKVTRQALDKLLGGLQSRKLPVLLAGMRAPRNMGADYTAAFDAIYPELAQKYGVILYPFFLDGVALRRDLTQADGMHPNAAGIALIAEHMLPIVEKLIAEVNR